MKKIKRIGGYLFSPIDGWRRTKDLDRECSEQREMQTWQDNPNCRGVLFGLCTEQRMQWLAKQDYSEGNLDPVLIHHAIYRDFYKLHSGS